MNGKLLTFGDIQLIPRKCIIFSRQDCETSVQLGNRTFKIPIIPSNMTTVVNEELCLELARRDYFYIMHRFDIDVFKFVQRCHENKLYASISVGVKDYDYKLIDRFKENALIPEYITIDIAHGHSDRVKDMIHYIKKHLKIPFIIAGNIATTRAASDLDEWGADCLKVGIGPGFVCSTRFQTGFGTSHWELTAIANIRLITKIPIILDGGLRYPGDVAKAICFGANFCMSGYLFAGHVESPGKIVKKEGKTYKEYYGSASFYNTQTKRNIEGKMELLTLKKNSLWDTFQMLEEALQSSISYSGGKQLFDLRNVDYAIVK